MFLMRDAGSSRKRTPLDHSGYLPGVMFRASGRRPNAHHMLTVFRHAADKPSKAVSAFTCGYEYPTLCQRPGNRSPDMFVRMFLHRYVLLRVKRMLTSVNDFLAIKSSPGRYGRKIIVWLECVSQEEPRRVRGMNDLRGAFRPVGRRRGASPPLSCYLAQHILQRVFQIVPAEGEASGFQALRQCALAAEHQY